MRREMDTDAIWAIALLYGTPAEREDIRRRLDQAAGRECPSCGRAGDIEDNGAAGDELGFLCVRCGHQWDAADIEVELPEHAPRGSGLRIVNHTPHLLVVRTREGKLLEVERGPYVGVEVRHRKSGEHVRVATELGAVDLAVREATWSGVKDLPPPEPGVIRVVTTHVAELAVLDGRPCGDLYVALQSYPGPDGGRAYKALCPAASASPALRLLLEARRRAPADNVT